MDNEIMVSICCLVYNHEKYLRKCLDGFIMQKTTFKYEVLIHDDASTDSSADIIREYEERYPDIIKPIYQTQNQYSKGVKISWRYQYPRAKGKYIALCEGDDYWIDKKKLQMQFDQLEKHPNCYVCAHQVINVNEKGEDMGSIWGSCIIDNGMINQNDFLYMVGNNYFQTSSFFFVRIPELYSGVIPSFVSVSSIGDKPLLLLLASKGDAFFINKPLSCYRHNSNSSWTKSLNLSDISVHFDQCEERKQMFSEFNNYTHSKYSEFCEYFISKYDFVKCQLKNDYKSMLLPQYSCYMNEMGTKEKMYVYLSAFFPKVMKWYKKIKRRRKCKLR